MKELATYKDLLDVLQGLTEEQLTQPIQVVQSPASDEWPAELMPGIAIGTVNDFGFYRCRSAIDNKYHAADLVLLIDANPFAQNGAIGYSLSECDGDYDNLENYPIWGKDGPTDISDQTAPSTPTGLVDIDSISGMPLENHQVACIKRRADRFRERD